MAANDRNGARLGPGGSSRCGGGRLDRPCGSGAGGGGGSHRRQGQHRAQQPSRRLPAAQAIAEKAVAVLVFPEIIKGGLGFGGQYGEGALRRNDATVGYYNIASASFGFQIGAQSYSQALFFMTEDALRYLDQSKGFEVGADANVAVINQGMNVDATSTTIQDPIVGFAFGQKGLMAGATFEGSKITRFTPKR